MTKKKSRIGFMQGRLSPRIDGKIQAFPWPYWEAEFPLAKALGLSFMEWTLDQERIFENPLMTEAGRATIRHLSTVNDILVPSLTGDCFMQAPFWKAKGQEQLELISTCEKVLNACADVGIKFVVIPLVDNGALTTQQEEDLLVKILLDFVPLMQKCGLVIAFESDFPPPKLAEFIARLPAAPFGINFDMGNSASLGWEPEEEIRLLATRIVNVHVKDRVLGGTTVPLGQGNVDFAKVFAALRMANYNGNFILQTARAADDDHMKALRGYSAFVTEQIGG